MPLSNFTNLARRRIEPGTQAITKHTTTTMRHWFDLTCPFCYLAQPRNEALLKAGAKLVELPFQAHPDVPPEGHYIGPRHGPMYDSIATQARASNLPLHWRDRLPNSRTALAAVEWARQNKPELADKFRRDLFHAHFAGDKDIGDRKVILDLARADDLDAAEIEKAWQDGSAFKMVDEAQQAGVKAGAHGTPAWEAKGRLVSGLQSQAELDALVALDNKM